MRNLCPHEEDFIFRIYLYAFVYVIAYRSPRAVKQRRGINLFPDDALADNYRIVVIMLIGIPYFRLIGDIFGSGENI